MIPPKLIITMALASLSGCASYEWQRQGADERMVAMDMEQCRGLARLQSSQPRGAPTAAAAGAVPGKDDVLIAPHPATGSPMEMDEENSCMQQRGYRLVRVPR